MTGTVAAVSHHAVQALKRGGPARAHVADYLGLLVASEQRLVKAFGQVRSNHPGVPDMQAECTLFAQWSQEASRRLVPFVAQYGEGTGRRARAAGRSPDPQTVLQRVHAGARPDMISGYLRTRA